MKIGDKVKVETKSYISLFPENDAVPMASVFTKLPFEGFVDDIIKSAGRLEIAVINGIGFPILGSSIKVIPLSSYPVKILNRHFKIVKTPDTSINRFRLLGSIDDMNFIKNHIIDVYKDEHILSKALLPYPHNINSKSDILRIAWAINLPEKNIKIGEYYNIKGLRVKIINKLGNLYKSEIGNYYPSALLS